MPQMEIYTTTGAWVIAIGKAIEYLGKDIQPLLQGLDIQPDEYLDPDYRISASKLNELFDLAADLVEDPCFAVSVAWHIHPSVFSVLGYGMLASENIKEVLERLVNFQKLVMGTCDLDLKEAQDQLTFIANTAYYQDKRPVLSDGLVFSLLTTVMQFLRVVSATKLSPLVVKVRMAQPDYHDKLVSYFGCDVCYEQDVNALVFEREPLERSLPTSNPQIAQIHDQMALERLNSLDSEDIVAAIKSRIIESLSHGIPSQEMIAKELNMSLRNLQRKLELQGTGFKEILDSIRRNMALQYLKQPRLSLGEISHRLGFSSATNFSRAFKRWTNFAPGEYRAQYKDD